MSGKSLMDGSGESYRGVVPAKQPNKGERSLAEVVEERPRTKENTPQPNSCRTQIRENGPSGLERVRGAAKRDRKQKLLLSSPDARFDARIRGKNRVR